MKANCEKNECSSYHIDEGMNCVNKCTSELCYNQVYSEEPLEDGEIDMVRSKKFTDCVRKEIKDLQYQNRVASRKKK